MSHRLSDPEAIRQFRRRWSEAPATIKFLSELNARELDRLTIFCGERVLAKLPLALTRGMTAAERHDLAQAFGRPLLRRAQQRRAPGG